MTQKDLGEIIDRTDKDVSNYECGVAKPPADELLTMMVFFEIGPLEISE